MEWKDYEDAVFIECSRIFHNSAVHHNIYIKGVYSKRKRQIDILVKDEKGSIFVFDAKRYDKKVDVKTVESFIGMIEDVGANYGVLVSEKGFTKSAINRAHNGKDNIEVDILSMNELKMFQAECAIPYAGNNGVVINAPFCWIIDGTYRGNMAATLYRRGISFDEATLEKEWAYINFWNKNDEFDSLEKLISWQNSQLLKNDEEGSIEVRDDNNIKTRVFISKKYPTKEVTLYREFNEFILFVVLFSPDNLLKRNMKKMRSILLDALPFVVDEVTESE